MRLPLAMSNNSLAFFAERVVGLYDPYRISSPIHEQQLLGPESLPCQGGDSEPALVRLDSRPAVPAVTAGRAWDSRTVPS